CRRYIRQNRQHAWARYRGEPAYADWLGRWGPGACSWSEPLTREPPRHSRKSENLTFTGQGREVPAFAGMTSRVGETCENILHHATSRLRRCASPIVSR